MSSPLEPRAYPTTPPTPSGPPAGYLAPSQPDPNRVGPPKTAAEIEAMRGQFWEFLLREVVKALVGFFVPGGGTAFEQLQQWAQDVPGLGDLIEVITGVEDGDLNDLGTWFNNVRNFLAQINFLELAFDPIEAAIKFWKLIIEPGGQAVSASDVLGSTLPLTIPFTVGDTPTTPVRQWFVDIPQAIVDLVMNVVNAFAKVDPTGITGRFAEVMQLMFDMAEGIFTRAALHSAQITALQQAVFGEVGGVQFGFDGPQANLNTLGWHYITLGAAGMGYTQTGTGYVRMTGAAGADSTVIAIFDDTTQRFESHIQSCAYLTREKISSQGQAALWMPLRVNPATLPSQLDGIYARVSRGGTGGVVQLGIQLGGVATDLDDIPGVDPDDVTATGLSFKTNDRFDFTIGDPDADPITQADQYNWRWRWYLNGELILDTVFNPESWNASAGNLLNPLTHYCPAFGMSQDFIFIFLPDNVPPTSLDGIAYYTPKPAAT